MDIERIGIVGCGLMGSGIAEVCARAGADVVVREPDEALLKGGRQRIEQSLARAVRAGKLTEEEQHAALAQITFVTDWGAM
ncbi:MAG TPA: 3-hydroxyacyl-CoA dehydrogenase NAD-binding domain-containing protein, partial [Acidimicrobiales bacterium]|nr:3-hydroxyacyl-CoA dehydrogenase NAD-binding domain-containing protein [Acidimicrobiales bacterium]